MLLLLVLVRGAFGDGKMWATSTGEIPDMPSQRAFLSWQNGVETLIVESDFSGKPGEYTWLIPVPSKPDKIEALEPGALETLQTLMPIRLGRADGSLTGVLALAFIGGLVALNSRKRARSVASWAVEVFTIGAILFILTAILFPVFAGGGSRSGAETVGSYSVNILGGEAGLAMEVPKAAPASLRPVLDQYAKEGWSVVAAQLNRTEDGLATPHPLRITFRSSEPIYPMRLTGVGEDKLHLDLFVLGVRAATHTALHRFSAGEVYQERGSVTASWGPVSHPDIEPLLSEGLWLTRLSGILSAGEMAEDLQVRWGAQSEEVRIETAVDPSDAFWFAANWVLGVASLALVVFGAIGFKNPTWSGWGRPLLWSLVIGVLVAALQVVPVPEYERGPGGMARRVFIRSHSHMVESAIEEAKEAKTAEEAEATFFRKLKALASDQPPRRAVPGGYTLKRVGDKVEIAAYDWHAKRTVHVLP